MIIDLPKDSHERRRALHWLVSAGIRHMHLFQSVQIDSPGDAARFKFWLDNGDDADVEVE